jgi:hypothetical protein
MISKLISFILDLFDNMRYLNISDTKIGDKGIAYITESPNFKNLE